MLNYVPEKVFLRRTSHNFIWKKNLSQKSLYFGKNLWWTCSSKGGDFGLEDDECYEWHYSMKTIGKYKKSSQNILKSLKQPFQNA